VGLFIAFAASQLRPVYDAAYELRSKTGLPVLGVVSKVMGDVDLRKRRGDLLRFAAGTGSLLGVYALGVVGWALMAARQATG
jgi:hypothetical protein